MKVTAAVIVRNELGRYLEPFITHLLEFCDEIRILDNCSDDGWQDVIHDPRVVSLRYPDEAMQDSTLFVGHAHARQRLLEFTLEGSPDWLLAIDADEFITDGQTLRASCEQDFDALHVCMTEVWAAHEDRLDLRQDGGWREHDIAMLYRPDRVRHGQLQIVDRGPATGRTPDAVGYGRVGHSCSAVLHMGWSNQSERQARYDRYATADGGRFHSGRHLESIMWPDERVTVNSREWPAELAPWKDTILERANRAENIPENIRA